MALVSGPWRWMPEPVETTPAVPHERGRPARRPGRSSFGGGLLLLVAIILVVVLSAARRASFAKRPGRASPMVAAGPAVRVSVVSPGGGTGHIALTGESRPYFSVTLYSKVSGYLTEVRVDKGDKVPPRPDAGRRRIARDGRGICVRGRRCPRTSGRSLIAIRS